MDELFHTGSIKIGTLYDYNDEQKYGSMVSDPDDSLKTFNVKLEDQIYGVVTENNFHPALPSVINLASGADICGQGSAK